MLRRPMEGEQNSNETVISTIACISTVTGSGSGVEDKNKSLTCVPANNSSKVSNQTHQSPIGHVYHESIVAITVFGFLVDIPVAVLLLLATNWKKKKLLVPWLAIMAMKMLGFVIGCCLYVHFAFIDI